jgi:RNA polymerase sigma factor (sigma-70 family)
MAHEGRSKPKKPRVLLYAREQRHIVPEIDAIARTRNEWVTFLGTTTRTKFDKYIAQSGKGMTVEDAVRYVRSNPWTQYNTGGRCKKGHPYPEGTGHIRQGITGRSRAVCTVCAHERSVAVNRRLREARAQAKKVLSLVCRRGHRMTEENTRISKSKQGYTIRACKTCVRMWYRERARRKREMLPPPVRRAPDGMTLDAKLAHFSEPQASGCVFWTGTYLTKKQYRRPLIHHRDVPNGHFLVRSLLWRRMGKELPKYHVLTVSCGEEERCVAEAHIMCVSKQVRHSRLEVRLRARAAALKVRGLPAQQVERVMSHVTAIRRTLSKYARLREHIEDIAQEVLARTCAWMLGRNETLNDMAAFMVSTANRVAIDMQRRRAHRYTENWEAEAFESLPGDPACDPAVLLEEFEAAEITQRAMQEAMRHLQPLTREVLRMRGAGLSQKYIARSLGITEHTVENRLANAYKEFRERGAGSLTYFLSVNSSPTAEDLQT